MTYRLEAIDLDRLFAALAAAEYTVYGPRRGAHAIVLERLHSAAELPQGWTDIQGPGHYRLQERGDRAYFGYNLGPEAWKKLLTPPRQKLWTSHRDGDTVRFVPEPAPDAAEPTGQRLALLGVRACDLAALRMQNRVRRVSGQPPAMGADVLLIGVTCAQAADTCFCTSMGTGPALPSAASGDTLAAADGTLDLALTEVLGAEGHYFLLVAGSPRGAALAEGLPLRPASAADLEASQQVAAHAAAMITRRLEIKEPAAFFQRRLDHPQWEDVAKRCLSCANCTLVCPTCFCTTTEDVNDLSGDHAERWLRWDSCFNADFSYMHGGAVRSSTKSRYRQWLSHKLGSWHTQFGASGCVGCGRCIAWCPVGIDLTAETKALTTMPAPKTRGAMPP